MAKVILQVNSGVLLKKCIKYSESDTTLLEIIASIFLGDSSSLDQSSIAEVLIGKSFTETNLIETVSSLDIVKHRRKSRYSKGLFATSIFRVIMMVYSILISPSLS